MIAMPRTRVLSISPALNAIALTTVCDPGKKVRSHQKKAVKRGSSNTTAQQHRHASSQCSTCRGTDIDQHARRGGTLEEPLAAPTLECMSGPEN